MIASQNPSVMLLDIEGTTTPVSFVYETLFPYARAHMKDYLAQHEHHRDLRRDIEQLLAENHAETSSTAPVLRECAKSRDASKYLFWLMDQDRKSPALKSIQGKIWEAGYASGQLKSIVFDDVPHAFERWRNAGRRIAIYSSGSVLAQKLLFRHTQFGDMTRSITEYFDTGVGPKTGRESYARIAQALDVGPGEILFLSDSTSELEAAASAGYDVRLARRPGNREAANHMNYPSVFSFDEL